MGLAASPWSMKGSYSKATRVRSTLAWPPSGEAVDDAQHGGERSLTTRLDGRILLPADQSRPPLDRRLRHQHALERRSSLDAIQFGSYLVAQRIVKWQLVTGERERFLAIPLCDVTGGLRGRCARAAGPPGRRAGYCDSPPLLATFGTRVDRPRFGMAGEGVTAMIVAADAGDNPLADRREDRKAAAERERKAKVAKVASQATNAMAAEGWPVYRLPVDWGRLG